MVGGGVSGGGVVGGGVVGGGVVGGGVSVLKLVETVEIMLCNEYETHTNRNIKILHVNHVCIGKYQIINLFYIKSIHRISNV